MGTNGVMRPFEMIENQVLSSKKSIYVFSVTRYAQIDLENFDLSDLDCKFDVILLDPPLEEYRHRPGVVPNQSFWTWDDVSEHWIHRHTISTQDKTFHISLL